MRTLMKSSGMSMSTSTMSIISTTMQAKQLRPIHMLTCIAIRR